MEQSKNIKTATPNSSKRSLASLGEARFKCQECRLDFTDYDVWCYHLLQSHGYSFVVVK